MEVDQASGLARRSEHQIIPCVQGGADVAYLNVQIRRHYQRVIYEKRLASIDAMVKTKVSIDLRHLHPVCEPDITLGIAREMSQST